MLNVARGAFDENTREIEQNAREVMQGKPQKVKDWADELGGSAANRAGASDLGPGTESEARGPPIRQAGR